jgi:protein involved in polysaccharide export with SLBB domain
MKRSSLFLPVFFFIFQLTLFTYGIAQQKEAVKQQAEAQLQNANSDQIKAKIKELGMTEKEAEAKANALGIDLQKYLGIQEGKQESLPLPEAQQPQNLPEQTIKNPPQNVPAVAQVPYSIPGFEGRNGVAGLQPFGYLLFQFPTSTFEPVLNMPTSPNYLLGPGDEILLTMWGETQLFTQLAVNREGNIVVPNAGPVPAQGITVDALKSRLLRRLTSFYSGLRNGDTRANTWLDVSIGKLRTIQVFVLGEVKKPGGYAISSMSTSFLALYVAGGPSINGSLRSIDVLRNNKSISTIDFYDYALRGDKSKDIRLQDGDIVFVKTIGKRIAIAGNVIRPAIYELKPDETLKNALDMAGGLQVNAYFDRAHVERIIPFAERKLYAKNILDLDLKFSSSEDLLKSDFKLENGDIISILRINELLQNRITIYGNVKKPGVFALKEGMKISDLVQGADSLLSDTFGERATLVRTLPSMRRQIIPFNLSLAMKGDSANNFILEREDEITVYKLGYFFPEQTVSIAGAVRKPGTYTRDENMTVTDLVVMAGGLTENASKQDWELAKLDTTKISNLSKILKFSVTENYWDDRKNQPIILEDFDHLMVPSNPKFNHQRLITITGYVMYPGAYALQKENEKLTSIIKRAGGLRPGAYLEGSTIIRKWNNAGLVPVDFEKVLDDEQSRDNISMLDGDIVNIAFKQEVVLVRGEVFVPSAVVYKKGASLNYYLKQAGGLKDEADDGRIFVTLPNGKRWEESWFIFPNPDISGGSMIFVPTKIVKEDKTLPILRDWATITVSLAAIIIGIVQITK